jgi:uncharacterized protein Usg
MGCNGPVKLNWQPVQASANILFLLIFNEDVSSYFWERATGAPKMAQTETELMLKGYGLTTAQMIYRMPDYRNVLNTFVWQDYDLAPDYPRLFDFIEFWQSEIEGPLHSVRFTHRKLIGPGEWQNVVGEFPIH